MPQEEKKVEEQPEFEVESKVEPAAVEPKEEEKQPDEVKPTTDSEGKPTGTENQPKKKNRSQKRIETLSRDKRDLLKKNEELEAALKAKEPNTPNPDDFENYDDYLAAVENQTDVKPTEKEPEPSGNSDFQEVLDSIEVKFDETRDKYEDFDALVQKQPDDGGPHISLPMVEAMNEVDNSGEVAYALAKDVNESIRIAKLNPIKQVIAIQKLSDKLAKEAQQPEITVVDPKKVTKAAEPINPLGGGETLQKTLENAEGFSEYAAMRTTQNAGKDGW